MALRPVRGLRLPAQAGAEPLERLTRVLPSGRTLEARLLLPDDLRGTVEVEGLLSAPPYGLWLDGEATGLHVGDLDEVVESPTGQIILSGRRLDAHARVIDGLWLAWRDGRWSALLGNAYEPLVGGGGRTPYFLSDPRFDDDDRLSFQLRTFGWGPEGELPSQPAPPLVELAVSWRGTPLILRPKADRISLRGPSGVTPAGSPRPAAPRPVSRPVPRAPAGSCGRTPSAPPPGAASDPRPRRGWGPSP